MTGHYLFVAVLLFLVVVAMRWLLRKAGLPCQFCDNMSCDRFRGLTPPEKDAVLDYFRRQEHREPDKRGIFICKACRTVFDDFSGEKNSWEIDTGRFCAGPYSKTMTSCKTYCKVCNATMWGCDPDNDDIHCTRCGTHYAWTLHEKSGYRFLKPQGNVRLLKGCRDYTIGTG